ncbi:5,6-dimethylbenzimidazole synthase [uncultured Litoreibacter sp.]|uniref:5,6-dimethylbenzimidazole synthase n=1 Tax=uncultured Litoreibacter sp. TaxID=1392394 RepID=UPI0026181FC5|nr:5,6-dimethylbenzimidazole synthase [uncultured Litoreibacter sp.]
MRDFSPAFRSELEDLMTWRRDVRRFRTDPVDEALLARCLDAFSFAPSVGLSEPWRILRVTSNAARAKALDNYKTANAAALSQQSEDKQDSYAQLKLSGMQEAPVQLAIFCDEHTTKGHGLGAASMPEMRRYSVVSAITLFWLKARAEGLGVGWVSILDADQLCRDLDIDPAWRLVGYLCVGYPEADNAAPELEQLGWEMRAEALNIHEV